MPASCHLDDTVRLSLLQWAVDRRAPVTVSILPKTPRHNLRSQIMRYDESQGLLQIIYPICGDHPAPPEIGPGCELGLSVRRGHKKFIFVSPVVLRRADTDSSGLPVDTLILRAPVQMREMQRRLYQRVMIPADHMIPATLWQGGAPRTGEPSWPICSGRIGNISLGGVLVDIRADQNPRLASGETVGVEVTTRPGQTPLVIEARYRHCAMMNPQRVGLGLQFINLEQDAPGRATLTQVADYVRELRRRLGQIQVQADDSE